MTRPAIILGRMAILAAVLGIGLCTAVVGEGLLLSSPSPASIGQPPPALSDAEPVQIASASGSSLHGWWLPGTVAGGGSAILMHGVRGNRLQMVARAQVLHDHGFSVLLFDFEASGESPGRRITFGKLEGLDAEAALRWVRSRRPGERVGVIGASMGGAAALLGPQPLAADALVLESVYPDMDAALSNRLRVNLGRVAGPLLAPLLASLFETLMPPILGATPGELRPIDHIAVAGVPVLIASGIEDPYTPLAEAAALFDRAVAPKQFWAVAGAGHVDLEQFDPVRYWSVVMPFLDRYVVRRPERRGSVPIGETP